MKEEKKVSEVIRRNPEEEILENIFTEWNKCTQSYAVVLESILRWSIILYKHYKKDCPEILKSDHIIY